METYNERIARTRQALREAHARFVKRLADTPAADLERAPDSGGWSAAQIGWHVAAVNASFAGLLAGDIPGAKELPAGTPARPWSQIAAGIPEKLEAGKRVQPPPAVRRDDVLQALADAEVKLDAALADLKEERGARFAVTHPVLGAVALADVGDWAVAHIIRHNAQAKRVLGH